jgi:hypothetical protein
MVLPAQNKLEDEITEYERLFESAPDHPESKVAGLQRMILIGNP